MTKRRRFTGVDDGKPRTNTDYGWPLDVKLGQCKTAHKTTNFHPKGPRCRDWVEARVLTAEDIERIGEKASEAGAVKRGGNQRAKVEGKFGTCYTCESCVRKSQKELRERS